MPIVAGLPPDAAAKSKIITLPILLFAAASGGSPATIGIYSLLFALPPVLVIAFTARELTRHGNEIREQY